MKKIHFDDLAEIELTEEFLKEVEWIEGNPFYYCVSESAQAIWMLDNEKVVKNSIRKVFKSIGFFSSTDNNNFFEQEVGECFDYIILNIIYKDEEFDEDYFCKLESDITATAKKDVFIINNIFDLDKEDASNLLYSTNFVGEENDDYNDYEEIGNKYDLKSHTLSLVKKYSYGYYRDTRKAYDTKRYNDGERDNSEDTKHNEYDYHEDLNSLSSNKILNTSVLHLPIDTFSVEFSEYDEMFKHDLHIYDEDFNSKGLIDFKTKDFVYALFLAGFDTDKEKSDFLGIEEMILESRLQKFKVIVRDKTYSAKPDIINFLIKNKHIKQVALKDIEENYHSWKSSQKLNCRDDISILDFLYETDYLTQKNAKQSNKNGIVLQITVICYSL